MTEQDKPYFIVVAAAFFYGCRLQGPRDDDHNGGSMEYRAVNGAEFLWDELRRRGYIAPADAPRT